MRTEHTDVLEHVTIETSIPPTEFRVCNMHGIGIATLTIPQDDADYPKLMNLVENKTVVTIRIRTEIKVGVAIEKEEEE